MISQIKQLSDHLINHVSTHHKRDLYNEIKTSANYTTVIIWERWVGKSTLILQYLSEQDKKKIYFSADNSIISSLRDTVYALYFTHQVKLIAIDEIHQAHDWTNILKNIIDSFPELHLIISWSSSLDIYKGTAPLARRTHIHHLKPLSFREYCSWHHHISLPHYTLEDILQTHISIDFDIWNTFQFQLFDQYLHQGMYPFADRDTVIYHQQLRHNLTKTLIEDLPTFLNIQTDSLQKIKKLFIFIAQSTPSDLNYSSLSKKLWFAKERLETVISFLDKVWVLNTAIRSNKLSDIIRKEYKIFLGNPNIYHAYTTQASLGTIQESYVLWVLKNIQREQTTPDIILPRYGDFIYTHQEKQIYIEVGGSSKSTVYTKKSPDHFVIKNIHHSNQKNVIPMRMLGLI